MTRGERVWETRRIAARPAAVADAQVLFDEFAVDPAVSRFMTWTPHRSVDETREFLGRCERVWADGSAFPWSLWAKPHGAFLGLLEVRVGPTAVNIGYGLARRWWRQGFMSEAVAAVIAWAMSQPGIYRVWATCDLENEASARLLERVGMEREGVLRRWQVHPNLAAAPRDCYCYSIVKPE